MREPLSTERLRALMQAIAGSAPSKGVYKVYFVGGTTAVQRGWRPSTIDADLAADDERIFRGIQSIKEQLQMNIEFARPEDFVPALSGAEERHVFIESIGRVSFFHYDPYSQLFAKLVRGFRQDVEDAGKFLADGLVKSDELRRLIKGIPQAAYDRYPNLDRDSIERVVDAFLRETGNQL